MDFMDIEDSIPVEEQKQISEDIVDNHKPDTENTPELFHPNAMPKSHSDEQGNIDPSAAITLFAHYREEDRDGREDLIQDLEEEEDEKRKRPHSGNGM
jgi:hypothetical protein